MPPLSTCTHSLGITFQSAGAGLLFSTQFQQPAILLAEKAAYEDLRAKGVIDGTSPFAGHSLGAWAWGGLELKT